MSDSQKAAMLILVLALIGGALIQGVVDHEAAALGLSTVEIALAGLVIGSAVKRAM
jgi:hypothetical protein